MAKLVVMWHEVIGTGLIECRPCREAYEGQGVVGASCEACRCGRFVIRVTTSNSAHWCRSTLENTIRCQYCQFSSSST
jgi:hypothetical protein